MNKRLRLGVAALGVAFLLAIVLGASGVLTPKNQRTALGASSTLAIISGDVQVRHGATAAFAPADDGMVLGPGDTIRTGLDARAVLTYFEGSTVEIEPSSELAIEIAHGNPDGSTVIEMRQQLGTTWHVVTRLVQGGSKYEVHTNAATASVRGTAFTVGIAEDLSTTVETTEGNVATSDPASTKVVEVTPGLTTTTRPGERPADPTPAPEPQRRVTVTVGDQNTLVVDTLGRANGFKDGKKVVQTPGAQVEVVDGKLVVHLPNVPDGDITTHFQNTSKTDDVQVTTKVEDKGKKSVEVTETVKPSTTAVTGVEIKKSKDTTGSAEETTVKLKKIGDGPKPKVGEIVPAPTTEDQQKAAEDAKSKGTASTTTTDSTDKSNEKKGEASGKSTTTDPKVEPPKIELPKVEPPKIEPPKIEPPKVDPPKVDPPKVEPPKVEPRTGVLPDLKAVEKALDPLRNQPPKK